MSASALTATPPTAPPPPTGPTEATAREGYRELVALLHRRGRPQAAWDGIRMGSPENGVLVGLSLADAAPVFLDPFALKPRIFGIMGDPGTGRTFAAHLLALRARWTWKDRAVDIADGTPFAWPKDYPPHRRIRVVPRAVMLTLTADGPMNAKGAPPEFADGWAFRGLTFRMASPPEGPHFKPTEREWLPRARVASEAGYAEALLVTKWANLPVAVVASTPEYEYLTATLGTWTPARAERVSPSPGP
jgi:hypothetical protein